MLAHQTSEDGLRKIAWLILNAVEQLHVGKFKLVAFLKGSKSKDVETIIDQKLYGGLFWHDIPTIMGYIDQLEDLHLIQRKNIEGTRYYSYVELTDEGRKALEEKREIPLQIIKKIKPITVGESEQITYALLAQGKHATEIAAERNLKLSTIYTHFFRLIATNYLSVSEVISEEVIKKVIDAAQKFEKPTVKLVKELLPEISYDEIRCVLAELHKEAEGK
ncbi:MAG: helix-turn-helix domain-containing protein [Nanoarchaeota archaeon]